MSPNTIHIDLEDNEEVADMFSGCKAGQSVTITAEFTISEHSDDRVTASIDAIETVSKDGGYDEEEPDEDNEDEDDVEEIEDVMAVIRA